MTLPAVALYRVLAAGCEDAEGLPNAYGECILIVSAIIGSLEIKWEAQKEEI